MLDLLDESARDSPTARRDRRPRRPGCATSTSTTSTAARRAGARRDAAPRTGHGCDVEPDARSDDLARIETAARGSPLVTTVVADDGTARACDVTIDPRGRRSRSPARGCPRPHRRLVHVGDPSPSRSRCWSPAGAPRDSRSQRRLPAHRSTATPHDHAGRRRRGEPRPASSSTLFHATAARRGRRPRAARRPAARPRRTRSRKRSERSSGPTDARAPSRTTPCSSRASTGSRRRATRPASTGALAPDRDPTSRAIGASSTGRSRCPRARSASSRAVASGGACAARRACWSSTTGCASGSVAAAGSTCCRPGTARCSSGSASTVPGSERAPRIAVLRERARWDALLAQNAYSTRIFRSAYALRGADLGGRLPAQRRVRRCRTADRARSGARVGRRRTARASCSTPRPGATTAPRWSTTSTSRAFAGELGDDHVLLVRGHSRTMRYGQDLEADRLVDVTSYPNMADLLLSPTCSSPTTRR